MAGKGVQMVGGDGGGWTMAGRTGPGGELAKKKQEEGKTVFLLSGYCLGCRRPAGIGGRSHNAVSYLFFFSFSTYASMAAMAVMFTMSRTEHSKSVKWMGLFSPIWIGPMTSVSGLNACRSL